MSYTKVKSYTDQELLSAASSLEDFNGFPKGRWILYVRSNEDTPNVYDDKGYVFDHKTFVQVLTCTTNPGTPALNGEFKRYNSTGAALIKANQWCYDKFQFGYHNGRMPALRQIGSIWYHRDGDMDSKSEELGEPIWGNFATNIHTNTYKYFNSVVKWFIGRFSFGCIVHNQRDKHAKLMDWFRVNKKLKQQEKVSICILDEF